MFSDPSIRAIQRAIESGAPVSGPTDVQLLPTPRCNAACAFCPLYAIPPELRDQTPRFNSYREDLSGGLLDRLADDLYHLGGLKRLTITGGEPLLYSHLVPALFQFGAGFPQAELNLVTNGLRLKKFATLLVAAGLHNLTVSLNAGRAETYCRQNPAAGPEAFDAIVAGLAAVLEARKKLARPGPRVTISVALTRASAPDVGPLFELGRRLGVEAVTFVPLMELRLKGAVVNRPLRVNPAELARFRDEIADYGGRARAEGFWLGYADADEDAGAVASGDLYRRQPCYAGHAFAAVYPNGDVRPCCHCEPVMGNLQRHSFVEIWQGPAYARFREASAQIQQGPGLDGCLCGECGYCYENRELHRRLAELPAEERR